MYIKTLEKDIHALWMEGDVVVMLEQRLLPQKIEFYRAANVKVTAAAIRDMVVRGAPAIGAAGAYGMAQGWIAGSGVDECARIVSSARPTARDLFTAVEEMSAVWKEGGDVASAANSYVEGVVDMCKRIGEHGAPLIKDGARVLTHCNAGALATVDWGTALAPMRMAHRQGRNMFVWVDETRPWLQGSRLTAWELYQEGIEHAIIADNAAGHYMQRGDVDLVIVGADRVAANGDFANKIGTYEKAVVAKENGIPFYVAVPGTTFDRKTATGRDIVIEERGSEEVLGMGGVRIANEGSGARNPVFDVTPARYVTGYITEDGVRGSWGQ